MRQDGFEKYMLKKNITTKKQIELQLSDSDDKSNEQGKKKGKQRQLKLDDLFNNRIKARGDPAVQDPRAQNKGIVGGGELGHARFMRAPEPKNLEIKMFPEAEKEAILGLNKARETKQMAEKLQKVSKKSEECQALIFQSVTARPYKSHQTQQRLKQVEQQRRLKRLQKKQEQKKKIQQKAKKKSQTFKQFLSSITQKTQKIVNKSNDQQLQNITMFNKMEEQNIEKMIVDKKLSNSKANVGLVYQKLTIERQKVPMSFLKLLLSYKFSDEILAHETKKVPNSFEDQMTYKKVFHYLVINECIADIHSRLKKIEQGQGNPVPISISNFKVNSDGFIEFKIGEQIKQNKGGQGKDKQKFVVKNLSLSRNRLGLITNAKNFKLDHYGTPSRRNDRIFSYTCLLVTPQSKQQLNSQTKALCTIEIDSLDIILRLNKTNKCYFYDLEKISTHIRQYLAISHLYDTEVASFVYNPSLIEKHHLEMISEQEREQLEPILDKIKKQYNGTQYQSIREMALRETGIVLLQGPPGTGKTTTLMGLLAVQYEYLKNISEYSQKKKILICAPSNAAINHITKRLVCQGLLTTNPSPNLNFSKDGSMLIQKDNQKTLLETERIFPKILRVGIVETDDPDIISVSLDDICDKFMMKAKETQTKRNNMTTTQIKEKMYAISKEINKLKNRKDLQQWQIQNKTQALKFEIKKYEALLFNFRKQRIQLKQTYNQIQNKLFQQADIILTTLSSSGSQKMQRLRGFIGCLIVDQAAQSTEPTILIPLQTGVRKVLVIGDPYQLPATCLSQDSSITLFNRSLFERFLDNGVRPYFLNIQYRMAPMIRQFPSATFYNNRLVDADSVIERYKQNPEANQKLTSINQFFNRNSIFIDVKFGEEESHGNSYRNVGQCLVLKTLILEFIKKTRLTIGVITPYMAQKKHLQKKLKEQIEQQNQLAKQLERYSQIQKKQHQVNNNNNEDDNFSQNSGVIVQQGQISQTQKQQNLPQLDPIQPQKTPKTKSLQQLLQQRVMINTVDSFQGQQKDIIIVSTVRSNKRRQIGFLKDERRINVALTRSRHLLIVVGHGDTMGSNEIWHKYLEWSEANRCYYQVGEREGIKEVIGNINQGYSEGKCERVRHKKLTRDLRKEQRTEISREDFGIGIKGSKRIKRQRSQKKQKQLQKIPQQEKVPIVQEKMIEQNMEAKHNKDQEKEKERQLFEDKRAQEQQAIRLEQMNRRIRQLQQKMKMNGDNPYANLFS